MKKNYFLFLFGFLCLAQSAAFGQDDGEGFTRRPAIRFGFNFGGAWQCSDVRAIMGGGLGLTLEVPIIENDHSLIGVSLRGRYLHSVTYGRDWQRSTRMTNPSINGSYSSAVNYTSLGYYYANHRTVSNNWDLELMLKANRLRARTGILAYIWGGVGAMGYTAKVDQFDTFFGTRHDWASVSQDSKAEALRDIAFEMDRDYETFAEETRRPRWVFAPSVGIGLGYEFSPKFSMAFETKVTFPFTDLLDGQLYRDQIPLQGDNDIHIYGGLGLEFGLFGGSSGYTRSEPKPRTDINVYTPRDPKPQIIMVYPAQQNIVIQGACEFDFQARLYNVRNKALITVLQNGYTISPDQYDYNPSTGILSAFLSLNRGPNNITVIAKNSSGNYRRDYTVECDQQVIVPPPPTGLPPEVYITYPTGCPAIIHDCRTLVYAEVYRVRSKADITVYQYGNLIAPQYYDYDPYSRILTLDAQLLPGDNRIEIIARNPFGQARASTVLRCPTQIVLPAVVITNPGVTPYVSAVCDQVLEARVTGVRSRNDIKVYLNGQQQPFNTWAWSASTSILRMSIALEPGVETMVEIVANNGNGVAADIQVLRCEEQMPPPVVIIVNPPNGQYDGKDCNQHVLARVLNVSGPRDIRVSLGGQTIPGSQWTYDSFNQLLQMDVQLQPGVRSTYTITATNRVGSDSESASLRCTEDVKVISICHIPPGNPAGASTISIPEETWPSHQAHGDVQGPCSGTTIPICYQGQPMSIPQNLWATFQGWGATRGPCPVETITICHIPPRNPAGATTLTIPKTDWPSHQSHGDVQGPCSSQQVTVCLSGTQIQVPQNVWPVLQAQGATQGPCPVNTISICHIPPRNPAGAATMTIPETDWPAHQAHGDVQGPCSKEQVTVCLNGTAIQVPQNVWPVLQAQGATQGPCPVNTITICHIPPGDPQAAATMTIPADQWPSHQSHGDVQGGCSKTTVKVCIDGNEWTISQSALNAALAMGAVQGPCPVNNIQICHIPPRNPAGATTMTIAESEWPAHQAHGDVRGACSSSQITVCLNGRQISIPQNIWTTVQAQGATQGPCPVAQIVICHIPPSNPAGAATMTINESDWPSHQAHGDLRAACSSSTITACLEGNQVVVPSNVWPVIQAQGATQGPCPAAQIMICHIPPRDPAAAATMSIAETDWPSHQAHGDVRGPCSKRTITVCLNGKAITIPENAWPALQSQGATQGPCLAAQVTICHIPPGDPQAAATISIPETEWPAHQSHGDVRGGCSKTQVKVCIDGNEWLISQSALNVALAMGAVQGPCPVPQIQICHIPPKNPQGAATMSIPQTEWASHQAHGDVQGPCSPSQVTVCLNGNQMTVTQTAWPRLQSLGATQGPCPIPNIQICHIPPGQPEQANTLTIPETAWPAHQQHGDVKGACGGMIKICMDGNDMNISSSAWPMAQQMGGIKGSCPVQIQICHIPPRQPQNASTLTIYEQEWSQHQAHGDVKTACSPTKITVCLNGQTLQVSQTIWPALQAQGATQGACVQLIPICHFPPENPDEPVTLQIPANQIGAHLAHGDKTGACNFTPMTICHTEPGSDGGSETITIITSAWPRHQQHGDVQGTCPTQIKICHIPPGGLVFPTTMMVDPDEWAAHAAHYDHKGDCSHTMIDICHKPPGNPAAQATVNVSQSSWAYHQAHGDVMGVCPSSGRGTSDGEHDSGGGDTKPPVKKGGSETGDSGGGGSAKPAETPVKTSGGGGKAAIKPNVAPVPTGKTITICHKPPKTPDKPVTITIPASQWPLHQKHGDAQGPCPK